MKASDVIAIVSVVLTAATAIGVTFLTFRNNRQLEESRLQDERTQRQQETTRAMHREFHALEMTRSRGLAGVTVRAHYPKSFDWVRRNLDAQETQHVWNVMYFYQRLWLAIKYGNIHEDYVPEMFGENFWWWYYKSYEAQLVKMDPPNWQAGWHIEALKNWIAEHAEESERKEWEKRAEMMTDPETWGRQPEARHDTQQTRPGPARA